MDVARQNTKEQRMSIITAFVNKIQANHQDLSKEKLLEAIKDAEVSRQDVEAQMEHLDVLIGSMISKVLEEEKEILQFALDLLIRRETVALGDTFVWQSTKERHKTNLYKLNMLKTNLSASKIDGLEQQVKTQGQKIEMLEQGQAKMLGTMEVQMLKMGTQAKELEMLKAEQKNTQTSRETQDQRIKKLEEKQSQEIEAIRREMSDNREEVNGKIETLTKQVSSLTAKEEKYRDDIRVLNAKIASCDEKSNQSAQMLKSVTKIMEKAAAHNLEEQNELKEEIKKLKEQLLVIEIKTMATKIYGTPERRAANLIDEEIKRQGNTVTNTPTTTIEMLSAARQIPLDSPASQQQATTGSVQQHALVNPPLLAAVERQRILSRDLLAAAQETKENKTEQVVVPNFAPND